MASKDAAKRPGPSGVKISESFDCCKGSTCNLHRDSSMSVLGKQHITTWTSLTNMPKDIAELAIDAPVRFDVKGKNIRMHGMDEKLNIFQRAVISMKSEEQFDKVFVASKLDEYCRQNADKFFSDVLPLIEKELGNNNAEYHGSVAKGLLRAVKVLYAKSPSQAKYCIGLIFQNLESETEEIAGTWTEVANDLIDLISPKELEKEHTFLMYAETKRIFVEKYKVKVLPQIISKVKSTIPYARQAVCFLLDKIVHRLPPTVGAHLGPTINQLCEDPIPFVRATVVQHLGSIYTHVNLMEDFLRHINTFSKDPDQHVRVSLITALGLCFRAPEMKPLYGTFLGIIKKAVKQAFVTGDLYVLQEFTKFVGDMALVFSGALNGDNKLWFLDAYFQLTRFGLEAPGSGVSDLPTGFLNFRANMDYTRRHSLVESLVSSGAPPTKANAPNRANVLENGWKVRANAAAQFTSFVKFAKPLIDFKAGLQPLTQDLTHDPNPAVRAGMANCLWPVMEYLGNLGHLLYSEFVYTLSDDSIEVVEAVVPHLSDILKVCVQGKVISPEVMTQALVEVGGAIIFCEERLNQANNWRVHSDLLSQLSALPYCLPMDYIYSNFVPILFHRLLHLRPLPSRMAAADAIVSFLRHCRRANQREEIRRRIKESFANGRSVQDRMLFLFMSKKIIDNFSRKYFRDHFFEQTLDMADDAVPNVRLRVCGLMPELKKTLKADDEKLLQKLEDAALKIRNSETDRDVQEAIQEAIQDMTKIGVMFNKDNKDGKKQAQSPAAKTKADAEDEAKEREEAYIESLEQTNPNGPQGNRERRKSYFKSAKGAESSPATAVPTTAAPAKGAELLTVPEGRAGRRGTILGMGVPANTTVGGGASGQGACGAGAGKAGAGAEVEAGKPGDKQGANAGKPNPTDLHPDHSNAKALLLQQAQRIRRRTLVPTQVTMMKSQNVPK